MNSMAQEKPKSIDELKKELSVFIEKTMKKTKTVGLSFALVDGQEVIWAEGFGFADKANNIKATPQTIYRIGSISKLFTATSVMQLAESGKINIDNPIQTYIPEFKIKSRFANPGSITPRNILTHHAGLPSDILYQFFSANPDPFNSIVDFLNKEYTCSQPNTICSYSNAGFTLLGVLVERVSDENFYDYTQKHLFNAMDMKNSSFRLRPEMKNLFSKGYAEGKEFNEFLIRDVPAGMIHSNVLDMANFIKMTLNNGAFNGNQIIKAETWKEMQTRQNIDCKLDFNLNVGIAWWLNATSWEYMGRSAGHEGATYTYHGSLVTLLDHKMGVIVLDNTDRGGAAVSEVAKEILQKYLEFKTGIKPPVKVDVKIKADKLNEKQLNAFAGDYVLGTDLMVIKPHQGKLVTKQGVAKIIFTHNNHGTFSLKAKIFGFIPINIKNQQIFFRNIDNVDYMLFTDGTKDTTVIGERISKPVISDIWRNRFGTYEIVNDSTEFKIVSDFKIMEKDGMICVEAKVFGKDKMSLVLKPVSENEAIVEGIGRNTGGTAFFNGDEMYFAGLKLKKVVAANK